MHDFASDNHAGAHPEVLAAVAAANDGHAGSYGADGWTRRAEELFRRHFGAGARAFCVFNGTAANVLAIDALTRPHQAVICPATAHLNLDECGAPERFAGVKLLTVETEHGKLRLDDIARWDERRGDQHHVQPRVVSISQASELGTVLTNVFTGRPARGVRNRLVHDLGPISADAPAFPLAATDVQPLRAYSEQHGSTDFTPLWSGQGIAKWRDAGAAELTRLLWADTTEHLAKLAAEV